jgi:fructoselysine 6-kinase
MTAACVGDCGVDRYAVGEGTRDLWGGCSLNVALSLADVGKGRVSARLVSVLGDDAAGEAIARVVSAALPSSVLTRRSGATPVQRIELLADGERRLVGYEPGVMTGWHLSAEQRALIGSADLVHTLVFKQFEAAFREILAAPRRGGLAVDFMDLSDYGGGLDVPESALERVDVAFFGLGEAQRPLLADLRAKSLQRPRAVCVATFAERGSVAIQGGLTVECPAAPVGRVVDTTGAGDAFAGAFLAARAAGRPLAECLDTASRHAARVVSTLGATGLWPGFLS